MLLSHPLAKYNKLLMSVLGLVANVLYAYQVSNPNEWVTALLAVLTALGVYGVPNRQ